MEIIICTYYDQKSGSYDTPFFVHNELHAKRIFLMAIKDPKPNNVFSTYTKDIDLVKIGSFETATGIITPKIEKIMNGDSVAAEYNSEYKGGGK